MNATSLQGLSLELERSFEAPVQRVFEAWTDAGKLQQWFGPPGCRVAAAQVDLRPGGELRLDLVREPSGVPFWVSGVFREIDPPCRLACTWNVNTPDGRVCQTLLSVRFLQQGQGTRLHLRQDLLADAATREQQRQVMECCLKQLEAFLQ